MWREAGARPLRPAQRHTRESGAPAVTAEYPRTTENAEVAEFYPRNGCVSASTTRTSGTT